MPPIESVDLLEPAVYWPFARHRADGTPVVSSTPTEIPSRWVISRGQSIDSDGSPIATDASVKVDRLIPIGSVIREGRLLELPDTPDNLYEVVSIRKIKDIKSRNIRYSVECIRRTAPLA